ncbi:glycosyltransferase [Rhizobium sp. Root1220]|uniref:glycosyltransferase n=1 Tax=Rhizobium sp. Root1220 TaxID=1736432 RepID=UPI0006F81CEB|nr:glycosyltransferase [Rhizobium sp. Root1220]KQV70331.1 glycosyl transferase [Rhizobium sp. Root1220]
MSSAVSVAINGRFLTQSITGVQRYANNVVVAMEAQSALQETIILSPKRTSADNFKLDRQHVVEAGRLAGHAWEQIELPYLSRGRRLLNLCNTAPAAKSDQIICIHDANIFGAPESYSAAFRALYHNLQPILARRSVRVATVSYAAARQLARHLPVALGDIAVLPNGHEHALSWNPSLAKVAPQLLASQRSGRPFVLALGSRARHKNLALLIDAAPDLDALGIDVIVVGGGDGIFATEALQQRPNVRLAGRVSDDDLAYLLEQALCLAFPSLTEGFGLPIVEAMARGCPVIASNCASMPEVCGDAALLASPFEPGEWVQHARSLRDSAGLRSELVGRGLEQVFRFSWKNTAAGYRELLERPSADVAIYRPPDSQKPRVAVVVATRGRPRMVEATVRHLLASQTLKPGIVIISCVDIGDAGDLISCPGVTVLTGPAGLAAQRNTALARLAGAAEVVVFFDDDFVADKNWLASAAQVFRDESRVVGFTGNVVADGIKGPGIAFDEAVRLVECAENNHSPGWTEPYSPYGCNMAFRVSAIGHIRFDERLVLYGWLEDRDFAAAVTKEGGRLVKSVLAYGVHMGVKSGRVSGERLGYSQIINPIYMMGKGTMTFAKVVNHILGNTMSNFGRVAWPEPFIDRKGRARGNLLAMADALRGRLEPERAAAIATRSTVIQTVRSRIHDDV